MNLIKENKTEYDPSRNYKAIAVRVFRERRSMNVLNRVEGIIDSMAEPFDRNRAYHEMLDGDFDSMLEYIKSSSDQQLVVDIKNVLGV